MGGGDERVEIEYVRGQSLIAGLVGQVQDEEDEVEPRQQTRRQVDVLNHRFSYVVLGVHRIGCREDGRAGVQLAYDPRLSDRNRLLLHRLEKDGPTIFVHFVEFVNTANTQIAQDQGPRFKHEFMRLRVLPHIGSQADSTRASPIGEDAPRGQLVHLLQ